MVIFKIISISRDLDELIIRYLQLIHKKPIIILYYTLINR